MKWTWMCVMLLAMGCGGDDDDGEGGGDGPAQNCQARCEAKLESCNQAALTAACPSVVCGSATESQLRCVEAKSCDEITTAATSGMELCGIGGDEGGEGGEGDCPQLEDCACGVSGIVGINGRCAMSCDEACAALEAAIGK